MVSMELSPHWAGCDPGFSPWQGQQNPSLLMGSLCLPWGFLSLREPETPAQWLPPTLVTSYLLDCPCKDPISM